MGVCLQAVAAAAAAAPAEVGVPAGAFLTGSFGLASVVMLRPVHLCGVRRAAVHTCFVLQHKARSSFRQAARTLRQDPCTIRHI